MKLIRSPDSSEMCLVESTDGYAGWTVLSENVGAVPKKWERWSGQAFAEDAEAKKQHEDKMRAGDSVYLLGVIDDLTARVQELEGQLANQLPV